MLGADTKVLVRFRVRDDAVQFEEARKLIKREIAAGHRVCWRRFRPALSDTQGHLRAPMTGHLGSVLASRIDGNVGMRWNQASAGLKTRPAKRFGRAGGLNFLSA